MRPRTTHWRIASIFLALFVPALAAATDPILVDPPENDVPTGRYSPFAQFQAGLQRVLDRCDTNDPIVAAREGAGALGPAMRRDIERALACPALRSVPADSPARHGALTEAVWRAVMGAIPPPSVLDRAQALVMAFEGTDFGESPEWNFCQDGRGTAPATLDPKAPGFLCRNSSDPCSYLTWGPRGATAGSGREIQHILWMAWHRDRALVEGAFGGEFPTLQRLFRLPGSAQKGQCESDTPIARLLCAVWADPVRRKHWDEALIQLGRSPLVRTIYAELYRASEFDGEKLKAFAALWERLDLTVSEIDYAFFLDRITHLGGPPDDEAAAIEGVGACMRGEFRALSVNAAARRCLARIEPHERQPEYRRARDVAYYIDAYPADTLSKEELEAWENYIPVTAAGTFGLSDARNVPADRVTSLSAAPELPTGDAFASELDNACPANVLSPLRAPPNR